MADKAAGKSISLPKQKSASGLKLEADGKLPEMNLSNNCNSPAGGEEECTVREQDRFMPIANVIRIMRKILPPHAKIADDAKETIQECVSEYISFVTGEANERCQREQRKTITAEDVLWAMSKLGFDDYIEPLTVYLARFRDSEGGDQQRSTSLRPLESQFMKRPNGVEYGGMGLQATYGGPPQYPHFAHAHHGHPNGYMNYFKDNNAGGSSGGSSGSGGSSMGNAEEYK